MADRISKEKRSWNMSHIRSKDTKPEIKVRSYLFRQGFRFRKNVSELPGTPDIVLPKYSTVIFINGCFWHHHDGCKYAYIPKTRTEFWLSKFKKNVENDIKNQKILKDTGWKVIILWECTIKNDFNRAMEELIQALSSSKKK